MNLESKITNVNQSSKYVFEKLIDVKNYESLMPDSLSKFEVISNESFLFGLKGMPEIKLEIKEKTPNSEIILGAINDKLPFSLTVKIETISENNSNVQMFFQGEFNAMMAMMVKGPLSKLIENMTENMNKL